jgi:mRNA interferase MazF
MTHYRRGDILVTAFPFVDRGVTKRRPVLCVAHMNPQKSTTLYWVLMITSTETKSWPGDINIKNHLAAGLPVPSLVRTVKIACIDSALIEKKVGSINLTTNEAVFKSLTTILSN